MLSGKDARVGSDLGWCASNSRQLINNLNAYKASMLPSYPKEAGLVQELADAMEPKVQKLENDAAVYLEISQAPAAP